MLIPLKDVINKYDLDIKGVIQVGAHYAEEHDVFVQLGINDIVYIEPCENSFNEMMKKVSANNPLLLQGVLDYQSGGFVRIEFGNILMFKYACGENENEMEMYASNDNQGQSNSLLKPELHLRQHPEVRFTEKEKVEVVPLDRLPFKKENYNLLMMDVQGAEGLVLKGATETLNHIDVIYTEINRDMTYEGNMLIGEMEIFLADYGFKLVETFWPSPNWSWGDGIFIKNL